MEALNLNKNHLLAIYQRHCLWAMGIVILSACIALSTLFLNMKKYRQACTSTFIYYQNGSSVLVSISPIRRGELHSPEWHSNKSPQTK